ncbi:hypothetical protein [Dictyobacter formicarum]|uniref:Uncharacterized protein n=1 Tax=Dictyobacter formicarum TaxID=2778368 RepID=A0ABQ3VPV1_9CHLR|nr:hypothetical protein [Dictyobacter formicarum]GHO87408.1 hypothetical protein KSZ_54140 [Dictyobacter formicarum]
MGERQRCDGYEKRMLVREQILQAIVQMSMQDGSLSASLYVILDALEEQGSCDPEAIEQSLEELTRFENVLHGLQKDLRTLRKLNQ